MTKYKTIPIEHLHAVLSYDPDTGIFTKKSKYNRYNGKVAGTIGNSGYVILSLGSDRFPAHRVAFAIMTGKWPEKEIDHKDRNRSNNAWLNLREATSREQKENCNLSKNNSSGVNGVAWHKQRKKWRVYIGDGYRQIHIGIFDKLEDAMRARQEVELKLYGHSPLQENTLNE